MSGSRTVILSPGEIRDRFEWLSDHPEVGTAMERSLAATAMKLLQENEGLDRRGRQYCLELAEKAEEVRRLQAVAKAAYNYEISHEAGDAETLRQALYGLEALHV